MAGMIAVDYAGLTNRMTKFTALLNKNVQTALETIGEILKNDLHIRKFSAHPGYDLSQAFDKAIDKSFRIKKGSVGFLKSVMDAETPTKEGLGWWRLFEYGGITKDSGDPVGRSGGSDDYHFVPKLGQGKSGQGFMAKGGTHPGVYPTKLFHRTLEGNRKKFNDIMRRAVFAATKGQTF